MTTNVDNIIFFAIKLYKLYKEVSLWTKKTKKFVF